MTSKTIKTKYTLNILHAIIEVKLREKKWLLCCSFNAYSKNILPDIHYIHCIKSVRIRRFSRPYFPDGKIRIRKSFFAVISITLDNLHISYKNLLLLQHFTVELEEKQIHYFLNTRSLTLPDPFLNNFPSRSRKRREN